MLADSPVGPVLLSQNPAVSGAFCAGALGLEVLEESDSASASSRGGRRLTVTAGTTGSKDEQLKARILDPDGNALGIEQPED